MNKRSFLTKVGLAAFFSVALLAREGKAQVNLPFYEPFPDAYGDGTSLGAGASAAVWTEGNSVGSSGLTNRSTAALSYAGLSPATGLGVQIPVGGSSARNKALAFNSGTLSSGNPTVYASFLLKIVTTPSVVRPLCYMRNSTGSGTPHAGISVTPSNTLLVAKNSTTPASTPTATLSSGTHLIVLRYKFVTGSANDEAGVWVDPGSLSVGEANVPAPNIVTAANSDVTTLQSFYWLQPSSSVGEFYVDELRIGLTWADVTPTGGPVVGTKLGFTTQPADAQVNSIMNPVVVQVQNASGAFAASNNVPITINLSGGSGTLSGTLTRLTDATGKATFDNLSIDTTGTGKQLTANATGIGTGLNPAVSTSFTISDTPVLSGLVITQALKLPSNYVVGGHSDTPAIFCQVVGSSDLGNPNWILVNYANCDGNGSVTFTNPTSVALPKCFYALRTGNTSTKTEPPSITGQPANQTVAAGSPATFTVTASGPVLQYLWFFNGSAIANATTSSLTINSAQAGNAGNYNVIVANPAGSVSSATANLRVGNYAPTISVQPVDQTVTVGGTAIFTVVADGTAPLTYQWYYNTNNLLTGATNATLTLNNVQLNQAGKYHVVVANNFGSLPSSKANLTVSATPTDLPVTNMLGWAAYANATGGTYGGSTDVLLATNYYWFSNFVRRANALTIQVQGMITNEELYCYVYGNNKTIIGLGTNAGFIGDLRINATNIIIQNLYFTGGTNDLITIDGGSKGTGKNIWVDHCTFYNAPDGSVDITKGADYVTVSWCRFEYAPKIQGNAHEYVDLIGSSDSDDASQFHVTFHHNWYSTNCIERMPSVRFGRVHVFNNYYTAFGNNYCVRTRIDAEVLVENNYYLGVQNPWERYVTSGTPGKLYASGNITNNCTFVSGWVTGAVVIPGNDVLGPDLNPPPYPYSLNSAGDVPYYIQTYAGHGKYPYAP